MQFRKTNVLLIHLWIVSLNRFCFALKMSFSKGVNDRHQIFRTFIPVTIQTCRDECERRPRCVAAAYHRRYSMCELASRQDTKTNATGVVMLSGPKVTSLCGERNCTINEQCVHKGNERFCNVTECIEPERKFPTYFGSIYNIGSRIIYKGRTHGIDLQRTCLETGEWSLHESRVTNDCSNTTGPSGVYWQPILKTAVFCDMETDGGKWLVFQRREDGTVNFTLNWNGYDDGFGNLHGEFWMGLTTIHNIVSNSHYELRIDMENFQGEHGYAKYSTFSISGPQTDYTLTVSGFSGDRGDSLTWHNGMRFSTYDRDNDARSIRNCAEVYKGGWWYRACHRSNLNGLYDIDGKTTVFAINLHWRSWTTHWKSLKKVSMEFRRKL